MIIKMYSYANVYVGSLCSTSRSYILKEKNSLQCIYMRYIAVICVANPATIIQFNCMLQFVCNIDTYSIVYNQYSDCYSNTGLRSVYIT